MRRLCILLLLPLLAACSGPTTPDRLHAFAAVRSAVPAGWHEEVCSVAGYTVRFGVPPSRQNGQQTAHACLWDSGYGGLSVGLRPPDSLATEERRLRHNEDSGGDESVSRIRLRDDVPAFGHQRGRRLDWYCFCDGAPKTDHDVEAAGLRVSWSTPVDAHHRAGDATEADFQRFLDSISVRRGERDQCRRGRQVVSYVLPAMVDSVDSLQGTCHVYLLHGLTSEDYVEVVVGPGRTPARLAAWLRGRPRVSHLHLERSAVSLAGRRVDRVTWLAGHRRMTAVGDERVRISWAATAGQWEAERAAVRRFLASVAFTVDP